MKTLVIILEDLDFYPIVDHKQMKTINPNYNIRMGCWA